jgi:hypothetical protein
MSCFGSSGKSSLRICDRSLFADMRSELLRSKRETVVVQQENAALRQRIEELESASVRAPGSHTFTPTSPSVSVLVPGSHTSTPASPVNMPLDHPAEYLGCFLISSTAECCTSAAHQRTGISFCARPWLAHIHSCFALSICARPRLAHINSCFPREYALGSSGRIPWMLSHIVSC